MKAILTIFSAGLIVLSAGLAAMPSGPVPATPARAALAGDQAPNGCADFLAQQHKKPAHVDYAGCKYFADQQGKPLRAVYHVSGRYAAATEAYLIKAAGLNRLKHSCCQWDAPAHQFRDVSGRAFSINMVSGETTVGSRALWSKISSFEIVVERLTEEI